MHSLYSVLTLGLLTAHTALAATNIGSYSGIAGWRRNDVEKIYYQDDQGQIFQQELDANGGPAGNRTGPLPLGNYPAIFDSPLAVVQFANAQEIRLYYSCPSTSCPSTNSTAICELGSGDGGNTWYNGLLSSYHFCAAGVGRPAQFLYATVDNRQPRVGFRTAVVGAAPGGGANDYNVGSASGAGLSVAVWGDGRWNLTGPY
ncbi:hypothetical protein KC332_g13105 [Hortaea werneckii]|nr:hypothetical protein KC358_g11387 [Hortaea werneckii]KAI6819677.1 hypothetical protein KC350_g10004 [Hortaea werneckii]KAI6910959.1 hypothetical protein KC348_g13076 [Hortaea werneckii]KAI6921146.1 hypothetical protein KC341_g16117 [Hortaea werneckii]KAI6960389.1 hypothetical protein KC321_g12882 [Hortaea werneckii]